MVVQHNLSAMNANRMLGITQGTLSKSTEKLSSGYKVNRAADDAAGLAISEKMRKQIRGLTQASANAEDGISAVQTAEGALTEVHDMLQRMNELANKAANGTNSEADRQTIQDEISQLTTEIDRVAETTKFNEIYLLKGEPTGASTVKKVAAHDAGLAGKLVDNENGTATFTLNEKLEDGDKVNIAGKEYTIGTEGKGGIYSPADLNQKTTGYLVSTDNTFTTTPLVAGNSITVGGDTFKLTGNIAADEIKWADSDTFKVGDVTFTIDGTNMDAEAKIDTAANTATIGLNKVKDYINEQLAAGKQVVGTQYTTDVTDNKGVVAGTQITTSTNIVASLEEGEISTVQVKDLKAETVAAKATGYSDANPYKWKAGDSVTVSGITTTATSKAPASAKSVYDKINALAVDGTHKVKIGEGKDAVEYTIVGENDVDNTNFKVTKETVLSMIHDGDTVDIDGAGAETVIGDIGSTPAPGDIISSSEAYKLMAEELEAASSIGTDTAATVKHEGDGKFTITQGSVEVTDNLSFSLHVGADADMTNKISVNVQSMSAAGLGIKGINVADDDGSSATYAIDSISDAIETVSKQRSLLGAVQNRLEHTINNLDNVVENTTAAESQIRDTDMATEMVKYSNANILAQAGQSMLAQANQSNQGVLSILG